MPSFPARHHKIHLKMAPDYDPTQWQGSPGRYNPASETPAQEEPPGLKLGGCCTLQAKLCGSPSATWGSRHRALVAQGPHAILR